MPKELTSKVIVYTPGVWDLLHIGHVEFLMKAKALGDVLFVGVASDEVVREDKGQSPVISLHERITMLQALKYVDVAMAYYKLEFMTHLTFLRPNVLVIGEQWGEEKRHIDAVNYMHCVLGSRVIKLPYTKEQSTSQIKTTIVRREAHMGRM